MLNTVAGFGLSTAPVVPSLMWAPDGQEAVMVAGPVNLPGEPATAGPLTLAVPAAVPVIAGVITFQAEETSPA